MSHTCVIVGCPTRASFRDFQHVRHFGTPVQSYLTRAFTLPLTLARTRGITLCLLPCIKLNSSSRWRSARVYGASISFDKNSPGNFYTGTYQYIDKYVKSIVYILLRITP